MDNLVHLGLLNAALATLLALLAAAARCLRCRPAVVHALWLIVLLKLVTPPFLAVPIAWLPSPEPSRTTPTPKLDATGGPLDEGPSTVTVPESAVPANLPPLQASADPEEMATPSSPTASTETDLPSRTTSSTPAEENSPPPIASERLSSETVVAAVWLTGAVLWWSIAGMRLYRFRIALRSAWPAPAALQQRAEHLAARLGLSRCPRVYVLPAPVTPLLWAVAGEPCLLVPAVLWARLTTEQQDTLLAHELAHLRRGDPWIRRLEIVVLGLYWWHPVVWWARHEIQEAEEECCDAWVLWAMPAAAETYVATLLETVAYLSRLRPVVPLGASGAGQTHLLKRRLTMILKGTTPRALSWTALVMLLACGAVFLPLRPTWGQPPARNSSDEDQPLLVQAVPTAANAAQPATTARETNLTGTGLNSDAGLTGSILYPSDVEQAKDAIELLQVQLEGKKAELLESRALSEQARRQLARQEKLRERGVVSEEDIDQLRTELTVREARLQVKQAQIKEVEVRLSQAKRWLSRLQSGANSPAGTRSGAKVGWSPAGSISDTSPLRPTAVSTSSSEPVNQAKRPSDKPTTSTGTTILRGAGSAAKNSPDNSATSTGTTLGPRQSGSSRGQKIEGPGESDQRIQELERRLDELIKQVDALRGAIRRQRPGGAGEGSAPVDPNIEPSAPADR